MQYIFGTEIAKRPKTATAIATTSSSSELQRYISKPSMYARQVCTSTQSAWWLYLKRLIHKVRAQTHQHTHTRKDEKKIAAAPKTKEKKRENHSHEISYKKGERKKKQRATTTKPRKFWLCRVYTCCTIGRLSLCECLCGMNLSVWLVCQNLMVLFYYRYI